MPITISLSPLNVDSSASNFVYAIGTLAFSGNYPTGGDTLDFTQVADKLPSTQIVQAFAESQNGNSGYYVVVAGSALSGRLSSEHHVRHRPARHHRPQAAVGLAIEEARKGLLI